MEPISPVVPGLKDYEVKLGEGQPEYESLPALRSPEGVVLTRWKLTEEERAQIELGSDIYLSVLTFNNPFQAVKLEVGYAGAKDREREARRTMRLDDEFELRSLLAEANKAATELQNKQMALLSGDAEVKNLAVKAQKARQLLERKKAEVFSDKPSKIEVVQ